MGLRERLISKSILDAIFHNVVATQRGAIGTILAFFAFFNLKLSRYRAELFHQLRAEIWALDDDEYKESFRKAEKKGQLIPVGDLGYSGSTFFTTPNSKFLIKSVPRKFEHAFFRDVLLAPYAEHNDKHPHSLLVRITDLLYSPIPTLGSIFGAAPSHHIVMENILYGKEIDSLGKKWETYDLKPSTYFFPERDIAGGKLAPESVKSRLIDHFPDKIRVSAAQKQELLDILSQDTKVLQDHEVVDYSLFLVRFPSPTTQPREVPSALSGNTSAWRSGINSSDGKWIYRIVLLDFFWAKSALHAKAMTGLVKSFNLLAKKGPMSITAEPKEYRSRFLKMVDEITSHLGENEDPYVEEESEAGPA